MVNNNWILPSFITERATKRPRKRLFIGLVTGTSVLLCLVLLIGWIIPYIGLGNIHPSVPYISGFLLFLIIFTIAWSSFGLVLQILTGRKLFGAGKVRGLTIRLFLPLMEILGCAIKIEKDEVRRSFINVNNQLCMEAKGTKSPEEVLVLLPHCIQHSSCSIRISNDPDKCIRCGQCSIAALLVLKDRYGVHFAIATGGSIARRIVVQLKPRLIIAVACERDLVSGIQDTYPLPVFGILNSRPEGPCYNTVVTASLIEGALRYFINPSMFPEESLSSVSPLPRNIANG